MGNSSSQNIQSFHKVTFDHNETEKEAETVLWLQEELMNLNENNINQTVETLIYLYDFKQEMDLYQLLFNIILSFRNRPNESYFYVSLINEICKTNDQKSILFKDYFLKYLRYLFVLSYLSLLFNCYYNHVFTFSDIVTQIEYVYLNYNEHSYYILILLCWFYDELKHETPKLFHKLMKYAKKEMSNRIFSSIIVETYQLIENIFNQSDISKNQHYYNQLRLTGFLPDSAYCHICNDDIFAFQQLVATNPATIDSRYKPTLFMPYPILHNNPSLLQLASFFGSIKIAKYLLLTVNDNDVPNEMSAIHYAFAGGNFEIVRLLESKNASFKGAIQIAVQHHQHQLFDWLMESKFSNLEDKDDELYSIIHYAAMSNNMYVCMYMIDLFNSDDDELFDTTDFHAKNKSLKTLFNRPANNGLTPLYYAVCNGCFDMVYFLLTSHYASILTRFRDQNTILHVAAHEGNPLICKFLLSIDTNMLNILNSGLLNPIQISVIKGHDEVVSIFLKQPNFDINMKNQLQRTLLHLAITSNHYSCAKILLQKQNVYLSPRDYEGRTPLHIAAMNNQIKCMKLLLKQDGIDINARDHQHQTPLHTAITFMSTQSAKLLINHSGIDLNIPDKDGISLINIYFIELH